MKKKSIVNAVFYADMGRLEHKLLASIVARNAISSEITFRRVVTREKICTYMERYQMTNTIANVVKALRQKKT
jgi:hypothetical protein